MPLTQMEALLAKVKQAGGALQQVAGASNPFTLRFAAAQTTTEITLDNTGRIIGLFIQPLIPRVDDLDVAIEQFAARPGDVSVLVQADGVLNLPHWLATEEGTAYCVVVTQNRDDAAVDEALLANLTRATIGLLGPSLPITNSTGLTETSTITATTPTTNTGSLTTTAALTVTTAPTATTTPTPTATTTSTGALTTTAPLVFTNVRLFDGETVITSTNVLVEDGLITTVGTDVEPISSRPARWRLRRADMVPSSA